MATGVRDQVSLIDTMGWDERIMVCRCGTTVDAFIVVTARYVILVDTMTGPETAAAMLELAAPHLHSERRLLVINTHADWDHCWGNQLFSGVAVRHAAPIVATRRCAARLHAPETAQTLARMRTEDPARFTAVRLTSPTVLFDDRLTIDGGDLTLELFATPGHTEDHLSIFIPEARLLLAGDAAEAPFPFVSTSPALPALRASLRAQAALHPAHALYCHAPVTAGPALLARNIAYFDRLEAACRAALARGVVARQPPGADFEELVGFTYAEAISATIGAATNGVWDYREGHQKALRLMLAWLDSPSAAPS